MAAMMAALLAVYWGNVMVEKLVEMSVVSMDGSSVVVMAAL